ncbi:MAG: FAD-dependent oxidoreductase [Clostridia bacterium]|nr:FAD-dependent oxidoreductase [Clostridia bacterium]
MAKTIVVGGTFAGVQAACALAEAGAEVTLLDAHAFLGGDIAASRHTYVINGEEGCRLDVPNGRLKMELYAQARDAGVEVLFGARVCGVLTDGTQPGGVVFATKYGIFAVRGDLVLDATEAQVCAYHLTGQKARAALAEFSYDMSDVEMILREEESVPEDLGITDSRVRTGWAAAEHAANVTFRFPVSPAEETDRTALERHAHELMAATAVCLRERKGFENAVVSIPASHTRLLYEEVPQTAGIVVLESRLPADFTARQRRKCEEDAKLRALAALREIPEKREADTWMYAGQRLENWAEGWDDREKLVRLSPDLGSFPERHVRVLVAGAGTGGAMAGWACAMRGTEILLADLLYYCGGTNTVGRVFSAWHGYVDGMYTGRMEEVMALADTKALSPRVGAMMMWERLFAPNMVGGLTICGAELQDRKITGVLACGEDGFTVLKGDYVIDGTADGDVCAMAGLPYTVGGGRDGILQTSSMWGYECQSISDFTRDRYKSDADMIDVDSYRDLLRGLSLGYRGNSAYEIVEMCMQRESRRFACLHPLTMREIAHRVCPSDTIAVAYCTHDTHGIPSSFLNRFNLYSDAMHEPGCSDIRIRMPWGMFLPRGVKNVAIVGKSMAGEREAVNLCRMNPDLCNASFAAGWMVSHAASEDIAELKDLDVTAGQKELADLRVLPDWALKAGDALEVPQAIRRLSVSADGGFASMMQEKEDIESLLLPYLVKPGAPGDNAALALGWHGCSAAANRLRDMLKREAETDVLRFENRGPEDVWGIRADGFARIVNPNPRYGYVEVAMDDPDFSYSRVNRLLVLLAMSGGAKAEDILPFALRAEPGEFLKGKTNYSVSRIDTHCFVAETRLLAVGHALERIGDPAGAPALEALLARDGVRDNTVTGTAWKGITAPHAAFMELMLARAAAHCGSAIGAQRLCAYLKDQRSVFVQAARRGLHEVFGYDLTPDEWEERLRGGLVPAAKPYLGSPYDG